MFELGRDTLIKNIIMVSLWFKRPNKRSKNSHGRVYCQGKKKKEPKPNTKYRNCVAYPLLVIEEGTSTTLKEVDMSSEREKSYKAIEDEMISLHKNSPGNFVNC